MRARPLSTDRALLTTLPRLAGFTKSGIGGCPNAIRSSTQACIHAAGQIFPKNTLYNAICDLEEQVSRGSTLIDVHGHSFSNAEIQHIRRSPEFERHARAIDIVDKPVRMMLRSNSANTPQHLKPCLARRLAWSCPGPVYAGTDQSRGRGAPTGSRSSLAGFARRSTDQATRPSNSRRGRSAALFAVISPQAPIRSASPAASKRGMPVGPLSRVPRTASLRLPLRRRWPNVSSQIERGEHWQNSSGMARHARPRENRGRRRSTRKNTSVTVSSVTYLDRGRPIPPPAKLPG
jgi:hypothetical protein